MYRDNLARTNLNNCPRLLKYKNDNTFLNEDLLKDVPKQPNALRVNVKYITTFHQCIYYGSNKHFGYNYFIYALYVPILYIL